MKLVLSLVALALVVAPALAAAPTIMCASSCTITGSTAGFLAPATLVTSGAAVSWISADIGHINADGAVGGPSCMFGLQYNKVVASEPITLTIANGALVGETATDGALPCSNAVALSDGSFALPYYCVLHSTMRGVLLVK